MGHLKSSPRLVLHLFLHLFTLFYIFLPLLSGCRHAHNTAVEAPTAVVGIITLLGSVCFSDVTMSEREAEPIRSSDRSLSPPWQQENLGAQV